MDQNIVETVSRMQRYIKDNLQEEITLYSLAKEVNYSVTYCGRIFKELTGVSPYQYVRALRLTEAARSLRDHNLKVIDVALDFMFDSHEGFTRAFSKEFGVSPKRYQKHPIPVQYFIPFDVKGSYLQKLNGGKKEMKEKNQFVFVQVIERPKRKAIIKRGIKAEEYFAYCEEVGCDVWGILESVKEALYEPAGFWLPKKLIKPNTSKYVQGVEVPESYNGIVPDGFELIDLEPCTMMAFQGEPFPDELFEDAIRALWESIKEYKPETYGYEWAEDEAPRFQLAPLGYRGYIEARPVRKLKLK